MKKIITLVIALTILPFSVLAQTAPNVIDSQNTPSSSVVNSDTTITIDPILSQGPPQINEGTDLSVSPQDTGTDQQTALSSVIEPTFDPNHTGSSTPIIIDTSAPLSPDPAAIQPENNTPNVVTIVDVMPQVVPVAVDKVVPPVADISTEELTPKDKYVFKLEGPATATKDNPDWQKIHGEKINPQTEKKISTTPNLVPDDVTGVLDISGSCTDSYFVVLLYKNKEDYNKNPTSYIFNKAFDCENGSYKYSIDELPSNLSNGIYYLLIGGQGETGTWKPITALTPITIQKTDDNQ